MIIDCGQCQARGARCGDCATTALVGPADDEQYTDLDPATLRALSVLANAGLIAPLRYAPRLARAS